MNISPPELYKIVTVISLRKKPFSMVLINKDAEIKRNSGRIYQKYLFFPGRDFFFGQGSAAQTNIKLYSCTYSTSEEDDSVTSIIILY